MIITKGQSSASSVGGFAQNKKLGLELRLNFFLFKIITVQQIENHGNKHWDHYAGLVESDER
jgi:hypothetical protein